MGIRKTAAILILVLICSVSGCDKTDNPDMKLYEKTINMTECSVESDCAIDDENKDKVVCSDGTESKCFYIANRNTGKFHLTDCNSVDQMKESNKENLNCTHNEAVLKGYKPCKNCNP